MRIQVKGRNDATVEAELRARVEKKLAKVARQVSPLADLEVELREESNPSIRDSQIAEATLHLKGVTLRATERSTDMTHSINLRGGGLGTSGEEAPRQAARPPPQRGLAGGPARRLNPRLKQLQSAPVPLLPSLR